MLMDSGYIEPAALLGGLDGVGGELIEIDTADDGMAREHRQ